MLYFSKKLINNAFKISKRWQESDVQTALNLINEWKSIRSTADVFGMSESMIRKQIAKKKEGVESLYI